MTTLAGDARQEKTGLGNYFIANYPPFSFWKPQHMPEAAAALDSEPVPCTPLGLYLHIPFCRKRCKFCYFRVYTDKNADEVRVYTDALLREVELYSRTPLVGGRKLDYVYFGGGTPSYLSEKQLRSLMGRLRELMPWDAAREVTFECEPGTLKLDKLKALKELGVTRLSLGVENFDDRILESNGRAHLSPEIERAYGWAREVGFGQINIDLISGMVGETWENWKENVRKTIELAPESVTIYQMELPFNTKFSKELKMVDDPEPGVVNAVGVADWPTKREWVDYAFREMQAHGYEVSSAYTVVKDKARTQFVYRDALWRGADMFGTGVASFGHVRGVHVQNLDRWEDYIGALDQGRLPLNRAFPTKPRERLIREMILQLKTGSLDRDYFRDKFAVDILDAFAGPYRALEQAGFLNTDPAGVRLTGKGLLQVDRLLPTFFEPEHVSSRYT